MEALTPQQYQALSLLASGQRTDAVAETVGIHRTTLWRWRRDPSFVAAWNQVMAEVQDEQRRSLLDLQREALQTLRSCMLSSRNEMVRLRAALTVLEKVEALRIGSTNAEDILQAQHEEGALRQFIEFS